MQYVVFSMLLLVTVSKGIAQTRTDTIHHKKVYVVNGMGWGFTAGKTKEVLTAKYSGNLGLDISLKDRKYFLYPSLDFLVFDYNQQEHDPGYPYDLQEGRSNFYMLNLAAGMRRQFSRLNTYAYAGPGAGVVVEPRSVVLQDESKVRIDNIFHLTPSMRAGIGADYKLGNFFLFLELGWLHNFRKIQDRPVHVISMFGGLKTDVTRIADNVVKVIGTDGSGGDR